jgi:hypothetical protein
MHGPNPFLLAVIGSLIVIVAGLSHALLKYPPYAPAIYSEQNTDGGLKAHKSDKTEHGTTDHTPAHIPGMGLGSGNRKGQSETEHGEEEGTEFWPPLAGYRLKITDTLVAAFTALLFFATVALWLATRNLVKGAESTARKQLRAYVWVKIVKFDFPQAAVQGTIPNSLIIQMENNGASPAYDVGIWISWESVPFKTSLPKDFAYPQKTYEPPPHVARTDSRLPLAPQRFASNQHTFNSEEISLIADSTNRRISLYLYGEIAYRDTFGERHRTPFCLRHDPDAAAGISPFEYYSDHNDPT